MTCTHYTGNVRCRNDAHWTLNPPEGGWPTHLGVHCEDHMREILREYYAKLGEVWQACRIGPAGNRLQLRPIVRGNEC